LLARKGFKEVDTLRAAKRGPEVEEFVGGVKGMRDHAGSAQKEFESTPGREEGATFEGAVISPPAKEKSRICDGVRRPTREGVPKQL
jgi:hypothetical protein